MTPTKTLVEILTEKFHKFTEKLDEALKSTVEPTPAEEEKSADTKNLEEKLAGESSTQKPEEKAYPDNDHAYEVVRELCQKLGDKINELGDSASAAIRNKYSSLREKFYTDGKYDPEKAKHTIGSLYDTLRSSGEKVAKDLKEKLDFILNEDQSQTSNLDLPTDEEMSSKYKGIGIVYEGKLERAHYDECIKFITTVDSKLKPDTRYRKKILDDIRATGSRNIIEIERYYDRQDELRRTGKLHPPYGDEREKKYILTAVMKIDE